MVVSVIGIDGAGKTTQVRRLCAELADRGLPAVAAKTALTASMSILRMSQQRFGDPFAYHAVLPGTLEYFVLACEVAHYHEQVVAPAVAQGRLVVWDRGPYCPVAYAAASGSDLTWIRAVLDLVPEPELVALLDLDPLTAYRRLQGRGPVPQSNESVDRLGRVRTTYEPLLPAPPRGVVVDAEADPDTVTRQLLELVVAAWTKPRTVTGSAG